MSFILSFTAIFLMHTGEMFAQDSNVHRVRGIYQVKQIEKLTDGGFSIAFSAVDQSAFIAELHLESDHVHFSLKEGERIKLSADVVTINAKSAECRQLVIFMPHVQGYTPIWLISRKFPPTDSTAARYLEMHAPQSDFRLL
jgi:hypothetical protein